MLIQPKVWTGVSKCFKGRHSLVLTWLMSARDDIVVVINSFNMRKYVWAATELCAQVVPHVKHVIIAFGGCDVSGEYGYDTCHSENVTVVAIAQNLSDHNAFLACRKAASAFSAFSKCLHVYMHDTCRIAGGFGEAMQRLHDCKEKCMEHRWVFAHTYGLYNMGVCSQEFLFLRGTDFEHVTTVPKDLSIKLEQGERILVDNVQLNPLHAYSNKTLARHAFPSDNFERGDSFFVNSFSVHGAPRFISYIGSLSIYKPVGACVSYFVPVWASPSHSVNSRDALQRVTKSLENHYLYCDGVKRTCTHWLPLLPLD